jgi:hypothetical protein
MPCVSSLWVNIMTGTQFYFGPHIQSQYERATRAAAACHARNAYDSVAGGSAWTHSASRSAAHTTYGQPSFDRFGRAAHADHAETGQTETSREHGARRSAAHGAHGTSTGGASGAPAVDLPRTLDDAYAALHLQPGAPHSVVKAAYRALAHLHHPDTGGDPGAMTRINAAYAAIQQRVA